MSNQTAIPEPYENLTSLRATAVATKELVEVMAGQRGPGRDAAVTWNDLINLGLIQADQVPVGLGSDTR